MAAGTNAGLSLQASRAELPAATTTVTPAATALSAAVLWAWLTPRLPKLMLITDGDSPDVIIQSIAFVIHE